MLRAVFTSEAEDDLGIIVDFIARDNVLAALSWLQNIREVCDLLAAQPGIGQRLQTHRLGEVRRHVVGNYLVYYQPCPQGINVVRVVHGARDQERMI